MFFTPNDILNIKAAMTEIGGVGFDIESFEAAMRQHSNGEMRHTTLEERSFLGLAKLWKVVQRIISLVFVEKMLAGKLTLQDEQGNVYGLVVLERRVPSPVSLWPGAGGVEE